MQMIRDAISPEVLAKFEKLMKAEPCDLESEADVRDAQKRAKNDADDEQADREAFAKRQAAIMEAKGLATACR